MEITQEQLARSIGSSQPTIHRVISKKRVTRSLLKKFISKFGQDEADMIIEFDTILGGKNVRGKDMDREQEEAICSSGVLFAGGVVGDS